MKRAAALIAASLAWTGCSVAGPARPLAIQPGQDFSLKAGETAHAADSGLRVGFDGVAADSRCPKGERCVWAGEAMVKVWLQQGSGQRQARELRSTPGAAQAVQAGEFELQLVRLDPYPVSGRVINQGDYIATLTLSRAAKTATER